MKKLLRKLEVMMLLFAVCFISSMHISKSMCNDIINRDMGYMFNIMYDKSDDIVSYHVINKLEQYFFLNK